MEYYVSSVAQADGYHEVHSKACEWLPFPVHRISLGDHASCSSAVKKASEFYDKVDGCKYCSGPCHTR